MTQSPQAATTSTQVLPRARRPHPSFGRLARFVFLASLSAGFVMTWGLLSEVESRVEHHEDAKYEEIMHRLERLEALPLARALGPHWIVSYRDQRGMHTQLCIPEGVPDRAGKVALYCPQAAK